MKTLVLKQPWATLLANGIVDTLQFDEETDYRGRVLVYAEKQSVSQEEYDAFPIEWKSIIENHKTFGNLEDIYETEKFIGFADLVEVTSSSRDSIWSKGNNANYRWLFTNAHVFERPFIPFIANNANKTLLIETQEIDDTNFPPHHQAELKYPYYDNNELVIPIEDNEILQSLIYSRNPNNERKLDCIDFHDEHVQNILLSDNIDTLQIIRIDTPSWTARFEVIDFYVGALVDKDNNAVTHTSIEQSASIQQECFVFTLGKAIEAIPPIADAHVLQKVSPEHIFEIDAFYGLETPKGSKCHILAGEEGKHDRSHICIKKGKIYKDSDTDFWNLLFVTPYIGVWHAFLMKYYWTYLPLLGDAKSNQRYYVYSAKDLHNLIKRHQTDDQLTHFDATLYDVTPRIIFVEERKEYMVSACYWSDYRGLVLCELPMTLSEDCRVTFGKEKETTLFPYNALESN